MNKMARIIAIIAIIITLGCLLTACDFVQSGIVTAKYTTGNDCRIEVSDTAGNMCIYATDNYEVWEAVSIGDEFTHSWFGYWRPSITTMQ